LCLLRQNLFVPFSIVTVSVSFSISHFRQSAATIGKQQAEDKNAGSIV
jgi:hypothetical protein